MCIRGSLRASGLHDMQVLSSRVDMADFYARLGAARERVLMIDYDGTIAPFKIRPEQAVPYPGVAESLRALMNQGNTRVVIVSGRRAAEVAELLPLGRRPEIWGAHGWERVTAQGETHMQEPDPAVKEALAQAESAAAAVSVPGTRLERKPASIAFHWRGLADSAVGAVRERVTAAWKPLAEGGLLELMPFDGGLEMRACGTNKQHAVKAVLSETPPDAAVAYLGDDITDEDAFRAVKSQGLAVLVRPEYRETAADVWIKPPQELLAFLDNWRGRRATRA
jgi:trehalose 6-phosphate phosphatase